MKGLTKRQREILDFITGFIEEHSFSPSYREIMKRFDYSSLGSVYKHIQTLKRKGLLHQEERCSRSLSPVSLEDEKKKKNSGEIEIPFLGNISVGCPIDTFPKIQTMAIPEALVPSPERSYALRAQDDTLTSAYIAGGDILIVETSREAAPGDNIVALVHDKETYVRRYHPEGKYVRLEEIRGGNDTLILKNEHVMVQGILVALFRLYS